MTTEAKMRTIFFFGVLLLAAVGTEAQTNQGKDFWITETPNVGCRGDFVISIVNPEVGPATVVIRHPATNADTSVTVLAGELESRNFPCRALQTTGKTTNPVYHVTSDVDVVVYVFNPYTNNQKSNDASLILPVPALGKKHRLGSYTHPINNFGSTFSVVAVEDNTLVTSFDTSGNLVDSDTINTGEL
jgi:hypothetical protein